MERRQSRPMSSAEETRYIRFPLRRWRAWSARFLLMIALVARRQQRYGYVLSTSTGNR